MRILVNPFPVYEFLAASLIQGWTKLGHEVLTANHVASYAEKRAEPGDQDFDLSVQFISGQGRLPGRKSIFIEVVDNYPGLNEARTKGFDYIFVRDHIPSMGCLPINYGIEDRFYCAAETSGKPLQDREVDVCFLGYLYSGTARCKRAEWTDRLHADLPGLNMVLGDRQFSEPDDEWSRWTLSRDYEGDRSYCFAHDPRYFELLANSKICLSFSGLMADTGRTWEIMASGGISLVEKYYISGHAVDMINPPPQVEWFSTYDELLRSILGVLNDTDSWQARAEQAWTFNRQHHSSAARAQYVLDSVDL